MPIILFPPPSTTSTDPPPKKRNRIGVRNIFYNAMSKGDQVTLEQAIAILKAGW